MIAQFVFLAIFTLVSRANFMLNNATRFAGRKRAPSQRWAGASASEIVCQRASEQERERVSVAASTSDCSERLTRTGSPKRNDSPFRNWKRTDQNSRECKQGVGGEQREGERERAYPSEWGLELRMSAFCVASVSKYTSLRPYTGCLNIALNFIWRSTLFNIV